MRKIFNNLKIYNFMTIQSYMLQLRVKTGGGMYKKSRQLVMNQRSFFLKIGRGDRTRTCDSLVPNQERYQLRYTSLPKRPCLICGCKVNIFFPTVQILGNLFSDNFILLFLVQQKSSSTPSRRAPLLLLCG